ncbi:MAG: c-type cytochrome [Myxococcota bacterium]
MNYPVWQLEFGGGLLIALVAIIHVFVSHFAVGGGLFLVVTEQRAYRAEDAAMLGWLRRHAKFFALLTVVFGAVTGVAIWFTIGLVHPAATSSLIHIFVWAWAIEWVFFFVEIAAVLIYVATWDRLDRRVHLAIGWIYFVAALMSLVVINGILTFMFTPGAWLETRSFWDGFFNPTYLPALVVRALACAAFAGLYVLATAWREAAELRARLVRYAALWTLPATVVGPLAAYYFFRVGSPSTWEAVRGAAPMAERGLVVTIASAAAYAVLLTALTLAVRKAPQVVSLPVGLVLLFLGLGSIGGAEYVRENVRKPFVIGNAATGGFMYVNSLRPDELATTQRDGVLATAKWAQLGPEATDDAKGAKLFELACRACHTVDGYHGIRKLVAGKPLAAVAATLRTLDKRRGRMPPFPGSEAEVELLARYLAALDGEVEAPEATPPPAGDAVARGKALMEEHCLSCHALRLDEDMPALPPRVRGWTSAQAYDNLGRLSKLNPEMFDFDGTDEERHILADYLATIAKESSP